MRTLRTDCLDRILIVGLVRRELVRPDRAHIPGEDGFRFRHLLIRDAAYEALSKSVRAELHTRFADWLEKNGAALVELDEILGYHLEQAARYRAELGERDPELAQRAGERLAAAGRRALLREDYSGATNLFERSAALSADELDVSLEDDLVFTLFVAGRIEESRRRAVDAAERAAAAGNTNAELCFRIAEMVTSVYSDPEGVTDALEQLSLEAVPRFQAGATTWDSAPPTSRSARSRTCACRGIPRPPRSSRRSCTRGGSACSTATAI